MKICYETVRNSEEIRTYITQADQSLLARGFTEHSFAHVTRCAEFAARILAQLGYGEHDQELARIAGFMHDIGNVVNRHDHAQTGAVMAFRILDKMGMEPADVAAVITAIGHHDDPTAFPVNPVAAADFSVLPSQAPHSTARLNFHTDTGKLFSRYRIQPVLAALMPLFP